MSVINLGKNNEVDNTQVVNQSISDVVMQKARKEYYDCISFLRMRGVNVDKQMADKIKADIISYRVLMEFN